MEMGGWRRPDDQQLILFNPPPPAAHLHKGSHRGWITMTYLARHRLINTRIMEMVGGRRPYGQQLYT
eukprot:9925796-Heterocapsa_arctica.AAC.1